MRRNERRGVPPPTTVRPTRLPTVGEDFLLGEARGNLQGREVGWCVRRVEVRERARVPHHCAPRAASPPARPRGRGGRPGGRGGRGPRPKRGSLVSVSTWGHQCALCTRAAPGERGAEARRAALPVRREGRGARHLARDGDPLLVRLAARRERKRLEVAGGWEQDLRRPPRALSGAAEWGGGAGRVGPGRGPRRPRRPAGSRWSSAP